MYLQISPNISKYLQISLKYLQIIYKYSQNRGNFYVARPNEDFWDVENARSDFFVPKEKPRMDYESLTYVQMRDFIMSQAYGDIPADP